MGKDLKCTTRKLRAKCQHHFQRLPAGRDTERNRDLFGDDDDPNGSQHAVHNRGWEELTQNARTHQAKADLQNRSGDADGQASQQTAGSLLIQGW